MKKLRWLLTFINDSIGKRPVASISAQELLLMLRRMEGKGRYETAKRLRSTCSQIFRYAIAPARADRDVASDLRGALIVPKPSTCEMEQKCSPLISQTAERQKPTLASARNWAEGGLTAFGRQAAIADATKANGYTVGLDRIQPRQPQRQYQRSLAPDRSLARRTAAFGIDQRSDQMVAPPLSSEPCAETE